MSCYASFGDRHRIRGVVGRLAIAAVVVHLQFARATADVQPPGPRPEQFHAIVADLAAPAMQGRDAGTQGIDLARDYIIEHFKASSLAPAFVNGKTTSFIQPLELDLDVKVVEQTLVVSGQVLEAGEDFSVLGISDSGTFDVDAVFIGYGIDSAERTYDSFSKLDADGFGGRAVVVYRYEPMDNENHSLWNDGSHGNFGDWSNAAFLTNKAKWASQHGAAALLAVTPPSHQPGSKLKTTRGSIGPTAPILVVHLHHSVFERMLGKQADRPDMRAKQLQRGANHEPSNPVSLGNIHGRIELERSKAIVANVGAVVRGTGLLAEEIVVVGAHYDHIGFGDVGSFTHDRVIHPGADDNASGVAGLLLLAKRWSTAAARSATSPRRTVIFLAFAGEERGLLGSAYLVKHLEQLDISADQITAMVNLDMIGRLRNDLLNVIGVDSGDNWRPMLRRANQGQGLKLIFSGNAIAGSDHTNFYVKDIPVVQFFTGVHLDYHRPTDTADKVNAEGGVTIVRLIEGVLRELATRPQRLVFSRDASMDHRHPVMSSGAEDGAYLGIMPDYATLQGSEGCGIQAVRPETPAGKAGVKHGNVIIPWNKKTIANVYDLTDALRDSEGGEKLVLGVRRGEEVLKLQVTLGRR